MRENEKGGRSGRGMSRGGRFAGGAILALTLGGCAVAPTPFSGEEHAARVDDDRVALFADQEPVTGPISLYEAMARAIKYNLDHRLKAMEQALSQNQLEVGRYDLLPNLVVGAGYAGRDNFSGAVSRSLLTGRQSLEPSTSQDRDRDVADLSLTWNVLDFGVSYVRAQQNADRVSIAEERRRKVIHNIIQDVRSAYWRAASAQRLLGRIDPLLERVQAARADSREIERRKLRSPEDALRYQRAVLDTLRQLHIMRRELMLAKTQLAALMNLPPDQPYEVVAPEGVASAAPKVDRTAQELERLALLNRPELREEAYQSRISAAETRRALYSLLPGLEFNYDWNYDSNSYLFHEQWNGYGLRVTWNLLNLFTAGKRMELAETAQQVAETRRLALNMAVMTQVHVAYLQFHQAAKEFDIANDLSEVEGRILEKLKAGAQLKRRGQLDVIGGELDTLIAELRRDIAYGEMNNAMGRLMVSVGADPLPETVEADDVATLSAAIKAKMGSW